MGNYFSIPAFFVLFRETLEAAIIISVLLTFCKQMFANDPVMYRRLRKQVWLGTALGLAIVIIVAAVIIGVFYALSENIWEKHEMVWEGALAIIATFIITIVGVVMLKSSRVEHQEKWRLKLMKEMDARRRPVADKDSEAATSSSAETLPKDSATATATAPAAAKRTFLQRFAPRVAEMASSEKYALFFVPFITILREGIEAVVFMGGIGLAEETKSLPIAAITGILVGALLGVALYVGGSRIKLKYFFIASTALLFIIAAGLFARGIRSLEADRWFKSLLYPSGSGDDGAAIPVNIRDQALWYLTCCDPRDKGWSIFQALAGWSNIGTKASVSGYCMYWVAVIVWLVSIKFVEHKRKLRQHDHHNHHVGKQPAAAHDIHEEMPLNNNNIN
ncbi:iron permease FTR1 family-domain-containing protein [Powellomyces hirtus]|nr:iron permease FTR1 family-domain-containing protein [Powellomyces hirtus]